MEDDVLAHQAKLLTVGKEATVYCVICENNDYAVHIKTIKRSNVIIFLATQLHLTVCSVPRLLDHLVIE
jgi:hypothetical protein